MMYIPIRIFCEQNLVFFYMYRRKIFDEIQKNMECLNHVEIMYGFVLVTKEIRMLSEIIMTLEAHRSIHRVD